MHASQRALAKMYIEIAVRDEENGVMLSLQTVVLTMDMSQNGQVPHLGADQCGKFYYMSPKNQFIFGVVDNGTKKMNVYIWGEGKANRGADNIVSCLNWDLKRRGIIDGTKVKKLVIIADNCPSQNKNFCVLKFCCWVVEAGWAGEVELLFLIKGHTKNECDVKFNILKKSTHGVNIFTERGLDHYYTKDNSDQIDLVRVEGEHANRWRGFTAGLSSLYHDPSSAVTLKNHIFKFGGTLPKLTIYSRQLYRDDKHALQFDMMPTNRMQWYNLSSAQRANAVAQLYNNLNV